MITILSYPGTRGVRITWAAEELGIPYQFKLVNLYKGEHKHPDYLAIAPTGKVPAIQDEHGVLTESGAIVTYLADSVQQLIPKVGTRQRGEYEQMMYFVMTEFEQPLWTMGKHKFALPEEKRIAANIELGAWEFQNALRIFSTMLGDKPYVLGEEFSVADVVAGHTLSWAKGFKQPLSFDNIEAYAERVLSRPALARARAAEQAAKDALEA